MGNRKGFSNPKNPYPEVSEAFAAGTTIADCKDPGGRRVLLDFLRKSAVVLDDEGAPTHIFSFVGNRGGPNTH